jgi:hypothetical protein
MTQARVLFREYESEDQGENEDQDGRAEEAKSPTDDSKAAASSRSGPMFASTPWAGKRAAGTGPQH